MDLPNAEEELAACRAELAKAHAQLEELKEINSSLAKVNIALRQQLAPPKTNFDTLENVSESYRGDIDRGHDGIACNVYYDGSPPNLFANFIDAIKNTSSSGTPNIPGYKLPYKTDE